MNVREPEGSARWEAAGRPVIPSLEVDGVASGIMHVSQIASLLGLGDAGAAGLAAGRLAWDISLLLDAWVLHLRGLDRETIWAPTPSRERSLRNLTVNTFHPITLLPAALETGEFPWRPEDDEEREAALPDAPAVVAYAEEIALGWQSWLLGADATLAGAAGVAVSHESRGDLDGRTLLAAQRWHVAFHYRQLRVFLAARGSELPGALRIEALAGLDLPADVF